MLPLFEMMLQAQNGTAMEAMSKQFGLAQEQAAKAMAALMPAFSSGLKRNAANPYDMTALMGTMASGDYGRYFEDIGKAFTPQGTSDGNSVLGSIFGSKDVSRAVAAQAEQLTGIGQEIFQKMLPVIASTIMGGILKQSMGQIPGAAGPFSGGALPPMMQQWLESTGFSPKPPPEPSPFDNPFTQAMQSMFGMTKPEQPQKAAANPFGDNPFARAFEMMGSFSGQKAEPAPPPAGEQNPYAAMVNSMFDSGLEVQKSYQKSVESIFDSFARKAAGDSEAQTDR
jgi:hypothetical protein